MNIEVLIFLACSIAFLFSGELLLYLQKNVHAAKTVMIFRIVTWLVLVPLLFSPIIVYRFFLGYSPNSLFNNLFLIWLLAVNSYVFLRYLKNQCYTAS